MPAFMPPSSPQLPTPPIPPPGGPPAPDPSQQVLSPTTMVMNYLQSKGMQPNNPNFAQAIRAALEQNARQPGLIPGLENQAPPAPDPASAVAAQGQPQGGSGAGALPTPPMPPAGGPPPVSGSGDGNTSAQPASSGGLQIGPIGAAVAAGLPAAALGYGAARMMGGASGGPPMPMTPGSAAPPMPDVGAGVPGALPLPNAPPPTATQSPMETAMQRAMQPAGAENLIPGVIPPQPGAVSGMPVGPSTANPAVLNEANIGGGLRPAPNVPFNSPGPRVAPRAPIEIPRVRPRIVVR